MDNSGFLYTAAGALTILILLLLIFLYYRLLVKKMIVNNDWFGKNEPVRLFNAGLTAALFTSVRNILIIYPFEFALRLVNSFVTYLTDSGTIHALVVKGATGDSGSNSGLFQALYQDATSVFAPDQAHFAASVFNVIMAVIFLVALTAMEQTLLWDDTRGTYSVNHMSYTMKKTLGLLIVILIGFYLLFVALVATSKIATSTYDPHITLNHLDSLLNNDVKPDDIKRNLVSTDTALNSPQLTLSLFQLDTTIKSAAQRKIQFSDYPAYKNEIFAATSNLTRNYHALVMAQSQQVSKLLSQLNILQTQVNNAYTENSVNLTNPEREKYVGQLSDYYTNILQTGIDQLTRTADYIQGVHTEIIAYLTAVSIQVSDNMNKVKSGSLKQLPVLPYSPGEGDFGIGGGYQQLKLRVPIPDKPSAEWGFVGLISSWLTDTTSLNLVIIIGMLGFGIFGAGISTFITKEVEEATPTDSILESMTRVIVKGFSAALVIYLVAKSGLALANNSNSDPNPYFLYFSCLAGAVFSDRIWDWARSIIDKNYNPGDNNLAKIDDKQKETAEDAKTK